MLPEVVPSSQVYGETDATCSAARSRSPAIAGDQQAATFGQACFEPGTAKNTYGTGCFLLMNTGQRPIASENNLLTTIGWGIDGKVTYCLEGSVFIAGAVVQWLRDGLGLIKQLGGRRAAGGVGPDTGGVVLRAGLRRARRAPLGPLRPRHDLWASRAARRPPTSPAPPSNRWPSRRRDLLEAMSKDAGLRLETLKVDGGASVNDDLMQFQADLLDVTVATPGRRRDDGAGRRLPGRPGRRLLARPGRRRRITGPSTANSRRR